MFVPFLPFVEQDDRGAKHDQQVKGGIRCVSGSWVHVVRIKGQKRGANDVQSMHDMVTGGEWVAGWMVGDCVTLPLIRY